MTVVAFAGLELRFHRDRHETGGSLDLFTMIVQPQARMPVAHHHESWDETLYGLSGTTTWRIDGVDTALEAGSTLFIPRRVVHGFRNDTDAPASCLVVLTPGALGPEYFQEMAELVNAGRPDPAAMKAVMTRYGLVPSP